MAQNEKITRDTAEFLLERLQFILDKKNCGKAVYSLDSAVLLDVAKHIEKVLAANYYPVKFDVMTGNVSFVYSSETF